MGHYFAEMMCENCGKVRCTCKLSKVYVGNKSSLDHDAEKWIVETENNFAVIQIRDYDKKYATVPGKYGPVDGMPALKRWNRQRFNAKNEAEAHAKQLLDEVISGYEKKLNELKELRYTMG